MENTIITPASDIAIITPASDVAIITPASDVATDTSKPMDAVLADSKPSTQDWLANVTSKPASKVLGADAIADRIKASKGKSKSKKMDAISEAISKGKKLVTVTDGDGFAFTAYVGAMSGSSNETREQRHSRLASELFGYTLLGFVGPDQARKIINGKPMTLPGLTVDADDANTGACYICAGTHGSRNGRIESPRFGLTRVLLSPNGKQARLVSDTCYSSRLIGHVKIAK